MTAEGALIPLDRAACLALLATQPVGRLVFSHRALPDVLPVNFRLEDETVLIRLASGSRAAVATRDAVVAFQVDEIDARSRTGWSVTVVGHAREITDTDELLVSAASDVESWVHDERDLLLSIAVERITGRRLVADNQGSANGTRTVNEGQTQRAGQLAGDA
jgi:nitroimidazol reductase NimA-like FMN-containing flavoprotein (pyridoxamine 5'-phosphate oxidase superfamily)